MKFLILVFFTTSLLSEIMQFKDYDFKSTKREYLVYEPKNFNKDSIKKLVIGFHGYSGTASAFESEITGGLNLIAEKYNFLRFGFISTDHGRATLITVGLGNRHKLASNQLRH